MNISGGGYDYFESFLEKRPVLLEELIEQSTEMSRFNESSVNTVRVMTFNTRSGIITPFGFFRTGRNNSFVDNAAIGGVFATIDTKRGIVCSEGCDEKGNHYPTHPDSGMVMKGFILPDWEQALLLCKEAAGKTPNLKYLAWDLAHTSDRGWMIVEVNTSGQMIDQIGTLTGTKAELKVIMRDMDLLTSYVLQD